MFNIIITDEKYIDPEEPLNENVGYINIGEYEDKFLVPFDYWQKNGYYKQWKAELDNLLSGKRNLAVLIISFDEPDVNNIDMLFAYLLLRENGRIFIQKVMIMSEFAGKIELDNLDKAAGQFEFEDEDGSPLLYYESPLTDISVFYQKLISRINHT